MSTRELASTDLQRLAGSLRDSYTKQSENYDACRTMSANGRFFFDVAYRTVDEMLGLTNEATVHVDMPVGTGRFLRYLRDHGRPHRMVGIDISPGMLRVCRAQAGAHSKSLTLARGNALQLPLRDNSVDILTSMRFFHLFPKEHWPTLLKEMHRVLRPGGFLIAELRNQFRGGVAAWVVEHRDRWFYGGRHRSYAWPHDAHDLFRAWGRIETRGAGLDGLGRLSTVAPNTARRLHEITRYTPWQYVAKELIVKAYKPFN